MNRPVLDDGFLSDHPYFSRIAISDENHPNNFQIFILSRTALVPYIVILLFVKSYHSKIIVRTHGFHKLPHS